MSLNIKTILNGYGNNSAITDVLKKYIMCSDFKSFSELKPKINPYAIKNKLFTNDKKIYNTTQIVKSTSNNTTPIVKSTSNNTTPIVKSTSIITTPIKKNPNNYTNYYGKIYKVGNKIDTIFYKNLKIKNVTHKSKEIIHPYEGPQKINLYNYEYTNSNGKKFNIEQKSNELRYITEPKYSIGQLIKLPIKKKRPIKIYEANVSNTENKIYGIVENNNGHDQKVLISIIKKNTKK